MLVVVLAGSLMPGCSAVDQLTGRARGNAKDEALRQQVQATQNKVMRFADQYVQQIGAQVGALARQMEPGRERLELLEWQLANSTAAVQVAAAPSPTASTIDMVVMVSLSRRLIEDQWVARYGERAKPVVAAFVAQERDVWRLLDGIDTEERRAELRSYINIWYEENRPIGSAAFVRFTGVEGGGDKAARRAPPSLLGIVGLDPLAGIDPAVREVEQARLLGERTVYYAQRLPTLLDIQVELLSARFAAASSTQRVLATTDQLGQVSASLSGLVGQVPDLVAREREAAIAQFMGELGRQQQELLALSVQLQATLEAGSTTAVSLDALVRSADQLVARFKPGGEPATADRPSGPPFDINDYTRLAVELSATARELAVVLQGVERLEPQVGARADDLVDRVDALISHLFWRLLLLVLAVLAAAVAYRLLVHRLEGSRHRG
jgi:hypothetical protein